MADEPKAPRKRAAKKAVSEEKKSTKKSPVIPVPLFQAAPVSKTPKAAKSVKAAPAVAAVESKGSDSESEEFRRRRRRGGRGRRRNGKEGAEGLDNESADLASDSESLEVTHKRRRRRRAKGEGVVPGETVEEDGVITVVKVREARVRPPRSEAKTFNRRDRNKFDRPDRRERRDFTRRRGTVITESEFLARREAVERSMLVRQIADRTQIAIIEDDVMVEHYVNRNSNISYVGNVYLGKVQNVLPSMEAAFVDIGKGRNAVLYAGEVNWDAHGLSDAAPRKIEHVLKSGQSVLVQVTKDPIGQKGARLTSQISLPGRYLVYVPGGGMSGISKRLPDNERNRLKSILKNLIPEQAGVIIRTAAEGAPEAELERDVIRLKAQWEDIEKKANSSSTSAPSLLYGEPDLTVRVIRDIFNEDFNKMLVQGDQAWDDIQNYIGHIAPELASKIEKWSSNKDLFTENRVEEQLAKAFDRKVYLPSGGSLVIDRTEAMIVIDVNTGKFIGKGGNLEETVTKNNLEAAEEIARQLRLRDMGGIIVIDFIDMTLESNRELVLRRLVECLGRDRTKHQVAEVTSLGLVQMTRKRVGQGLIEAFSTTCESCGGRGIHIHSDPVNKVALEKDMEQRYSKTSKASAEDDSDDELDNQSEVSQQSNPEPEDEIVETAPAA
ncbi:MAG: Rne/Rng family ribonuclease, partial [Actinobacteria bacterium]|nr:Rne/Rng family ribonuclease [Actinomycetota bacterium]